MSLSLLPSNDLIICRLVKAMYDATPGYTYLTNFKSYASDNGIDATANALAESAGFTAQNFKTTLLTNLGLADNADAGAYIDSQVASGASFGAISLAAVNALATGTFTGALATAQTAFNGDVTRGLTYSLNSANTTTDLAELQSADDETGKAFVLTALSDTVPGTALGDTITAAAGTFTSGDNIVGGEGADTLTATIGGSVTPAALTGVESVTVTATGTATVDMVNATGISTLKSLSSTGALTYDNVAAIADIELSSASQTTTVVFKDAALSGTNEVNLSLDGVTNVVTVGGETDADGDYETLNITSNGGASDLQAGNGLGADSTAINITGAANLDLGSTSAFEKVVTFDAAAFTGDLTASFNTSGTASSTRDLTISSGDGNDTIDIDDLNGAHYNVVTVNAGAGNDTVDIGNFHDTKSVIDGGDGTDTIRVSEEVNGATTEFDTVTNFEILGMDVAGSDDQDMDLVNGINEVHVLSANAVTDDITLTDAQSGVKLKIAGTVGAAAAGTGTNDDLDTVTVNLKSDGATDSMTLVLGGTGGEVNIDEFAPSTSFETVTIESVGTAENTVQTISTGIRNMSFTGSADLEVTSTGSLTGVADFSQMTGAVTTTTGTVALSVTGGAGNDDITTGTVVGTVSQSINSGDGDDTITAGAIASDADSVTSFTFNGGAGSDTIDTSAMAGSGGGSADDSVAEINGGTGIDFITLDTDADVSADLNTTAILTTDADRIASFTTTVDQVDFNGALSNGSNTAISGNTEIQATVAAGIAADNDDVLYAATTDLTGTAATELTALANATTVAGVSEEAEDLIAAIAAAHSSVTGLDSAIGADESVLLLFDNNADSVVFRFTNTTASGNAISADELQLVAVFDAAIAVAGDFI